MKPTRLMRSKIQNPSHPLIEDRVFTSLEGYVSHLIHQKAYEHAAESAHGKDVLDLGCNVGYGMEILASQARSVSGIDVSEEAVAAAQHRLGPPFDVRHYDGSTSSFPSDSFQLITSFQVIEHVSGYEPYFREILRLLRPGGTVMFTTPNALLRLDPGMKPWNTFHVREFTADELRELLSQWFERVDIQGLFALQDLYEIERARCDRSRANARSRPAEIRQNPLRRVARRLPWLVLARNGLRTWLSRETSVETLAPEDIARFSTDDLHYVTASPLDEALDFMAVCHSPRH